MSGQGPFYRSRDAPVEEVGTGVSRQILGHDPELMMVRVTFRKGCVGYVHTHPHRQVTYVERGSFEVAMDGRTSVLFAGDCYFAAPDVPHGVVALEDGSLIDVFTPRRGDLMGGDAG